MSIPVSQFRPFCFFPLVSMFVPYICVSISLGSFSFELCPVTTQHVIN